MALELPLPKDSDLPGGVVERLRSLPAINIYRMLGHAPQTVIPWTDLTKALYQSKLSPAIARLQYYGRHIVPVLLMRYISIALLRLTTALQRKKYP
jgi:hypothetical protein